MSNPLASNSNSNSQSSPNSDGAGLAVFDAQAIWQALSRARDVYRGDGLPEASAALFELITSYNEGLKAGSNVNTEAGLQYLMELSTTIATHCRAIKANLRPQEELAELERANDQKLIDLTDVPFLDGGLNGPDTSARAEAERQRQMHLEEEANIIAWHKESLAVVTEAMDLVYEASVRAVRRLDERLKSAKEYALRLLEQDVLAQKALTPDRESGLPMLSKAVIGEELDKFFPLLSPGFTAAVGDYIAKLYDYLSLPKGAPPEMVIQKLQQLMSALQAVISQCVGVLAAMLKKDADAGTLGGETLDENLTRLMVYPQLRAFFQAILAAFETAEGEVRNRLQEQQNNQLRQAIIAETQPGKSGPLPDGGQ